MDQILAISFFMKAGIEFRTIIVIYFEEFDISSKNVIFVEAKCDKVEH